MIYNSSFPKSGDNLSDLVWSGVGQSQVLVTPMHMAMIAGAVANGGVMVEPKLVERIQNPLGITTHTRSVTTYRQVMNTSTAQTIAQAMYQAVTSGTATRAAIPGHIVCGKTGSAEVSDDKSVPTHAWFVGFLAEEEHPYCVAVVVEHGGSGGLVAAPIGQKALQKAIEVVG